MDNIDVRVSELVKRSNDLTGKVNYLAITIENNENPKRLVEYEAKVQQYKKELKEIEKELSLIKTKIETENNEY